MNRGIAACGRSILSYSVGRWRGYKTGDHHILIAAALEAVDKGLVKRLIVSMPPRHGKSELISRNFPAWYLGRNPDKQIIFATYSDEFASDFGRDVRNQVDSGFHRTVFPVCGGLRADSSAASRFHTSKGGVYHAVGIGGGVTGKGADLLIIDDPIKDRAAAESKAERKRVKDWFGAVARTRLMPGGAVIVVMTRWHKDDLAGWLLRDHQHEGWLELKLPAFAESGDVLGRDEGAPLWPDQYDGGQLDAIKHSLSSYDWAALYQQRPVPLEGALLKTDWFPRYDVTPEQGYRVISVDTASVASKSADYWVFSSFITHNGYHYLTDVFRKRMGYAAGERALLERVREFGPNELLIENKGTGITLLQNLPDRVACGVTSVNPRGDKVTRMESETPALKNGKVLLPNAAPWLADFEDEAANFPAVAHDDQIDTLSQFLYHMRLSWRCGPVGTIEKTTEQSFMKEAYLI